MNCKHEFNDIYTYKNRVKLEDIIDVNLQCVKCGIVFTIEQFIKYMRGKRS